MKIIITGIAGYIGSVLSRLLLKENYEVIGIDKLLYGGRSLLGIISDPRFTFIKADINDVEEYEKFIDPGACVVHLAAIVGEPASRKYPEETVKTNIDGTKELITLAIRKNVGKFIFVSTCSNYGKVPKDEYATEDYELNPLSLYAETKVKMEKYLIEEVKSELNWSILRFATVYGVSPRPRFDLTVNDFTMHAIKDGKLLIYLPYSNRPYVHVQDAARAVKLVLENSEKTKHRIYNVGDTSENYRKIDIVNEIKKVIGDFKVEFIEKGTDLRDYKVSFERIKNELGYRITKRVPDGIREIAKIVNEGIITDFENREYYNT